ncbi:unnamed protein product, partial [Caretta caretta]
VVCPLPFVFPDATSVAMETGAELGNQQPATEIDTLLAVQLVSASLPMETDDLLGKIRAI